MKYILFALLITGCTYGPSVESHYISTRVFKCEKKESFFYLPVILAVCETKEECNSICEKEREKK